MIERYALLVDGAFCCKALRRRLGRTATLADVLSTCAAIHQHAALAGQTLLRIYYYDAPPATGKVKNPISKKTINLGQTPQFQAATQFQDKLELSPDVAFRRGDVVARGWKLKEKALRDIGKTGRAVTAGDLVPNLQQKGVDLRIGLDIARLSLRSLVSTIVVVTGDADMVPAFKFARREGVRVFVDHLGGPVNRSLKAHVDRVL